MIKRLIDSKIEDFYQNHSSALLITGARQVGKTFAIRQFAKSHFASYVEINFVETPSAIGLFDGTDDAKEMLFRLSAFSKGQMIPGETFVFFDEVQKYPDLVTRIKFLVEEGSFRYALSGSLLGVELKDLRSEPVGYMDVMEMYPISIEEFALAVGVSPQIIEVLRDCFEKRIPVSEVVHLQMIKVFQLYLVVGGMPAAVSKYLETNNLQLVEAEQNAIIRLYKRDISQYDPDDKLFLDDIYELIPSELNSKNKRFILKKLNENFKFNRYESSFLWLDKAGVALPVFNVEEPRYPLRLSKQRNLFKLFQNDVGLLASQYSNGMQIRLLRNEVNINYGGIYENVAAQELKFQGFNLYYFNSKSQGEIDFVVEKEEKILPIEIKSGKDYTRHNAIDNVLNNPEYHISQAYVFCQDNISNSGNITYFPIYMLMFMRQRPSFTDDSVYRLDIGELK